MICEKHYVISHLEKFDFYGFPDFDEEQRSLFLTFEPQEWDLIARRPSLQTQVYVVMWDGKTPSSLDEDFSI
jgi:hypothetical protein